MKKLRIKLNDSIPNSNSHTFELEIPFAGTYLKWDVIFSNEDLKFAPDFDFVNDQFLTDPDIDVIEKDIPALYHWNIDEPECLYNVVKQILCLYKKYQVDRLQVNKYERQYMEYTVLIREMNIPEEDIEVHIDHSDGIHFLVQLPIDVSTLPPYLGKYFENNNTDGTPAELCNPGQDTIMLRISYMNQKVQTNVWLTQHLEEVIGNTKLLRLPTCTKDMSLLEYIPAVKKVIHEKLSTISTNYKLRNQFVSTMLAYQGRSIIEYDNVTFSKMTLLLEAQENNCLVIIQLGKNFDKPILQLRSLYCERNSKPMSENLNYSYDPKASIEETVQKILNTVYCFLTTCKTESNHNSNRNDVKQSDKFSYAAAVTKQT